MNNKYKESSFMGKTFGRLTVTGPIVIVIKSNGRKERKVWCECKCGNKKLASIIRLIRGEVSSCGCLAKENYQRLGQGRKDGSIKSSGNLKHGGKGTKIYSIWSNMNNRCIYESCDNYKYYGGKGIKVCDEWNRKNPHGFENFRAWAYCNGFNENNEVDRIDYDKDYCPSNCRFINHKQNVNNQSNNVNITFGDVTHTASEWGYLLDIDPSLIRRRILNGWDPKDAITIPTLKEGDSLVNYKKTHKVIKPIIFLKHDDSDENMHGKFNPK